MAISYDVHEAEFCDVDLRIIDLMIMLYFKQNEDNFGLTDSDVELLNKHGEVLSAIEKIFSMTLLPKDIATISESQFWELIKSKIKIVYDSQGFREEHLWFSLLIFRRILFYFLTYRLGLTEGEISKKYYPAICLYCFHLTCKYDLFLSFSERGSPEIHDYYRMFFNNFSDEMEEVNRNFQAGLIYCKNKFINLVYNRIKRENLKIFFYTKERKTNERDIELMLKRNVFRSRSFLQVVHKSMFQNMEQGDRNWCLEEFNWMVSRNGALLNGSSSKSKKLFESLFFLSAYSDNTGSVFPVTLESLYGNWVEAIVEGQQNRFFVDKTVEYFDNLISELVKEIKKFNDAWEQNFCNNIS